MTPATERTAGPKKGELTLLPAKWVLVAMILERDTTKDGKRRAELEAGIQQIKDSAGKK